MSRVEQSFVRAHAAQRLGQRGRPGQGDGRAGQRSRGERERAVRIERDQDPRGRRDETDERREQRGAARPQLARGGGPDCDGREDDGGDGDCLE